MASETSHLLNNDSPPPPYYSPPDLSRHHLNGDSNKYQRSRSRKWPLTWGAGCYIILLPLAIVAIIFGLRHQGLLSIPKESTPEEDPPLITAIAIIGGGPAGISAAYHLSSRARESGVLINITIYERKSSIGGRLVSTPIIYPHNSLHQARLGPEAIAGASLLSSSQVLLDAAKELQIPLVRHEHKEDIGFFNGDATFQATRPSSSASWGSWLGQLYHYGLSPVRARTLSENMFNYWVSSLKSIAYPVTSLRHLSKALDLNSELTRTAYDILRENKISDSYIHDIVSPSAYRSLGQSLHDLHAVALSTVLYEAEKAFAFSNDEILPVLEKMAYKSNAAVELNTAVYGLSEQGNGQWILALRPNHDMISNQNIDDAYQIFDEVIIAAPLVRSEMGFKTQSVIKLPEEIDYKPVFLTFLISNSGLSAEYFNLEAGEEIPNRIFGEHSSFHEVNLVKRIVLETQNPNFTASYLFRVTSPAVFRDEDVTALLGGSEPLWIHRASVSQAYPYLHIRNELPAVKLSDSLWFTGGIEALGSSIELSTWMGKNVAGLVAEKLTRKLQMKE